MNGIGLDTLGHEAQGGPRNLSETNIGHGGPGLRKRYVSNLNALRRAVMGSLLVFALAFGASSAFADNESPTELERIARMRDQAGQETAATQGASADPGTQADAGGGQPVQAESEAESEEVERPLPPNESLPLGTGEGGLFDGAGSSQSTTGALGDGWLLSTLAALGVVIALVFGLRWALRRGGIVTTSAPQGSVVEVLSRTTVAPRSHVIVMRIGQRILIVNDSPAGMRTLATVDSPEEVAELLGAIDASRPTSMTKSFSGVMGKLSGHWSTAEAELDAGTAADSMDDGVTIDQARGAVSSVRGRLAALSGRGMKA